MDPHTTDPKAAPGHHDMAFLAMDPFPLESQEAETVDISYPLNEVEADRLAGQIRGCLPEDWKNG